jgi:hypothetical protein
LAIGHIIGLRFAAFAHFVLILCLFFAGKLANGVGTVCIETKIRFHIPNLSTKNTVTAADRSMA